MDSQEEFFKDQIDQFYEARIAKEENLEKMQQVERARLTQMEENPLLDHQSRMEEIEKVIQLQDEEMKALASEYEKLTNTHQERKSALACSTLKTMCYASAMFQFLFHIGIFSLYDAIQKCAPR